MTDREKAIVMAYTGKCMLTGNKFKIFHKYVEDIMGRPIWTHEMGFLADEIKGKSEADFMALCAEEPKTGHWILDDEMSDWYDTTFKCSCCGREIIVPYEIHTSVYTDYPYCHCGARMSEVSNEQKN